MVIRTAYPSEKLFPDKSSVHIWHEMLKDLPYDATSLVVYKWIATEKWSPKIAEIRSMVAEALNEKIPGCEDAWKKVLDIARDFSPYDTERTNALIAGLDDITRQCLKLVDINSIAYTDNIAVDRAHFIKVYKTLHERKKTENSTPSRVRQALNEMQPKAPELPVEQECIPVFEEECSRSVTEFDEELRERFL